MNQLSQGLPLMGAHQGNQDEDYREGRTTHDNSNKSQQQHRPPRESYQSSHRPPRETYKSSDHIQQQHPPPRDIYQSSDHLQQHSDHIQQQHQPHRESYQSSDHLHQQQRQPPRESYQSSDHFQQQQYQPQESYQESGHLQQLHRPPLESYQSSNHVQQQQQLSESYHQSFNHLQQQQHEPRESYQSSDHLPPRESYQNSDHLQQQQAPVIKGYATKDDSYSLINKVASDHQLPSVVDPSKHVHHPSGYQSSHSPTPRVKPPSTHDPNSILMNPKPRSLLYHEEYAMTQGNTADDSAEAENKNVKVKRSHTNKPQSSSSCCQ
ncbi:hypothetical protein ERO13_A10G209350v2 [Gossypium hirsutum]|nr:hypothetical protein ERO13_A10G209350v2 [Gossypium hirsutum]